MTLYSFRTSTRPRPAWRVFYCLLVTVGRELETYRLRVLPRPYFLYGRQVRAENLVASFEIDATDNATSCSASNLLCEIATEQAHLMPVARATGFFFPLVKHKYLCF